MGETSRSAYTRGKEHEKSVSNKEEGSALWKHCKEKHNNEVQRFKMNVTGVYSNDAMLKGGYELFQWFLQAQFYILSSSYMTNFTILFSGRLTRLEKRNI